MEEGRLPRRNTDRATLIRTVPHRVRGASSAAEIPLGVRQSQEASLEAAFDLIPIFQGISRSYLLLRATAVAPDSAEPTASA